MHAFLILANERIAATADAWIIEAVAWGAPRTQAFLRDRQTCPVWVRLPAAGDPRLPAVLDAVVPARPHGLILAGAENGQDIERLSALIRPREAGAALPDRGIAVVAAVETPAALLRPAFGTVPRLAGLMLDTAGLPPGTHDLARATTLLAASAAGIPAWLTDDEVEPQAAFRHGFAGIATRHPARLDAIRRVPRTAAELTYP